MPVLTYKKKKNIFKKLCNNEVIYESKVIKHFKLQMSTENLNWP